ncbi:MULTISPECIES: CsbD family protein [unclassified Mycobacterium]|uniref:CsbD family protein n=1 Tax=unclassified Mycobacterium TaxID=2642494 RepID=UPI0038777713
MGIVDKAKNAVQNASGKVKEQAGKVTGDTDTEAEGKKDQLKANVKKTGESIKDTFR